MRASKLMEDLPRGNLGVSSEQERFDGYEQRLIRWGCERCKFFEMRVFSSGVTSEELDAYIICRFAEEPIDLIGEAKTCPKDCNLQLLKIHTKSGWSRPHLVIPLRGHNHYGEQCATRIKPDEIAS